MPCIRLWRKALTLKLENWNSVCQSCSRATFRSVLPGAVGPYCSWLRLAGIFLVEFLLLSFSLTLFGCEKLVLQTPHATCIDLFKKGLCTCMLTCVNMVFWKLCRMQNCLGLPAFTDFWCGFLVLPMVGRILKLHAHRRVCRENSFAAKGLYRIVLILMGVTLYDTCLSHVFMTII